MSLILNETMIEKEFEYFKKQKEQVLIKQKEELKIETKLKTKIEKNMETKFKINIETKERKKRKLIEIKSDSEEIDEETYEEENKKLLNNKKVFINSMNQIIKYTNEMEIEKKCFKCNKISEKKCKALNKFCCENHLFQCIKCKELICSEYMHDFWNGSYFEISNTCEMCYLTNKYSL